MFAANWQVFDRIKTQLNFVNSNDQNLKNISWNNLQCIETIQIIPIWVIQKLIAMLDRI